MFVVLCSNLNINIEKLKKKVLQIIQIMIVNIDHIFRKKIGFLSDAQQQRYSLTDSYRKSKLNSGFFWLRLSKKKTLEKVKGS